MKRVGGILMGIVSLFAVETYAQKPAVVTSNEEGWKKIGETTASFKMQNESISVWGADEFSAIKIKVKDAPLNIERLQVFYESGAMEEIDVKHHFAANGESREISLKHPDRDIQKVAFTYKTEGNAKGEKAEVELYGLKAGQPQGSDAYRDDKKEVERDAEHAAREVEREGDEASNELREEKNEAKRDINDNAERSSNVVREGINDAAAAIKDEKLDDKVGPGGETVYQDDNNKFYYINDKGDKVFITAFQLKHKPDNK